MKWIFSKIPGDNSASGDDSSAALIKDKLKKFNIIGCPGCYPTSILLPLIPLVKKI